MSDSSATESRVPNQIVVFSLGAEEYALPITQVQEIIRYSEPRAVASEAAWIRGVISLRGRIIPVCDLATRLGVTRPEGEPGKIVIVETASSTAGIVVDEVQEVLTLNESDVQPLPVSGTDAIDSIAKIGDRLVVLLDTTGIFGEGELASLAAAA